MHAAARQELARAATLLKEVVARTATRKGSCANPRLPNVPTSLASVWYCRALGLRQEPVIATDMIEGVTFADACWVHHALYFPALRVKSQKFHPDSLDHHTSVEPASPAANGVGGAVWPADSVCSKTGDLWHASTCKTHTSCAPPRLPMSTTRPPQLAAGAVSTRCTSKASPKRCVHNNCAGAPAAVGHSHPRSSCGEHVATKESLSKAAMPTIIWLCGWCIVPGVIVASLAAEMDEGHRKTASSQATKTEVLPARIVGLPAKGVGMLWMAVPSTMSTTKVVRLLAT